MNGASGRGSGRVTDGDVNSPGQPPAERDKAPEGMGTPARRGERSAERRQRTSGTELQRLAGQLSQRDRAVLVDVDRFGFLTSRHLEILHFDDHATADAAARFCRRVLQRVRRDRLLEPLERRIGGLRAGSASYVWRLGPVGDRLLRLSDPQAPRARRKEPSLSFVKHRLAVASVVCDLTLASRSQLFELVTADPEPASWRRFARGYGSSVLKPDLFVVSADTDFEHHWFIEIDRSTESVPTVLKQCDEYERYRRSGREQADNGLFPRVVWTVPDDRRREQLHAAFARRTDVDAELFRVVTSQELVELLVAEHTQEGGGPDVGSQT